MSMRTYKSLKNNYTRKLMRMIKDKLSENAINPISYILQDKIRLAYSATAYMALFRAVHECIGTFSFACVSNLEYRESQLYIFYVNQSFNLCGNYEKAKHLQMDC